MARSVARSARAIDLGAEEQERLERALGLAMEPRVARLADDHHAAYLHPGRSALVLLRDVGASAAGSLALAAVIETEDDALAVDPETVLRVLGSETADALHAVPRPGDERLGERLVGLERPVALAALAERLDHLRHLHLRDDLRPVWVERHREASSVWVGFAQRTDDRLGARFAHWVRAFGRRVGS